MLIVLASLVVVTPAEVEVFGTFGYATHTSSRVNDARGTSAGLASGGGFSFVVRPGSTIFAVGPRIDLQRVFTGDVHLTTAHVALLFGLAWEHFRPSLGPSFHGVAGEFFGTVPIGISLDLAFSFKPLVVAIFADHGALSGASEDRIGWRAGLSFDVP